MDAKRSVSDHLKTTINRSVSNDLSVLLRGRISQPLEEDLARVESFYRGKGHREVNRSHIVRVALQRLVDEAIAEHPEIKDIPYRG